MPRPVTPRQLTNQAEQSRLYGAPLTDVFALLTSTFGIHRGRVAELLGLSAPMVSQLAAGHRVKIGNPGAVLRLQRLLEIGEEVRSGERSAEDALAAFDEEERAGRVLTRSSRTMRQRGAVDVQQVLRSAASASELLEAADALEGRFPALAELLRIYGAGRTSDAIAHFESVMLR